MTLDLNVFSDSEVHRDYDRDGFEQNQWYNNAFEVAYEGDDLTISVATKMAGKRISVSGRIHSQCFGNLWT